MEHILLFEDFINVNIGDFVYCKTPELSSYQLETDKKYQNIQGELQRNILTQKARCLSIKKIVLPLEEIDTTLSMATTNCMIAADTLFTKDYNKLFEIEAAHYKFNADTHLEVLEKKTADMNNSIELIRELLDELNKIELKIKTFINIKTVQSFLNSDLANSK